MRRSVFFSVFSKVGADRFSVGHGKRGIHIVPVIQVDHKADFRIHEVIRRCLIGILQHTVNLINSKKCIANVAVLNVCKISSPLVLQTQFYVRLCFNFVRIIIIISMVYLCVRCKFSPYYLAVMTTYIIIYSPSKSYIQPSFKII